MAKAKERTEGWGNLDNVRMAHYFGGDGRSLCGGWITFGSPRWETNQELGTAPTNGTCKACWKKREKIERPTSAPKGPKPLREGYGAAYRAMLHQEFLGVDYKGMDRLPAWARECFSRLFKEVENRRADIEALKTALRDLMPHMDDKGAAGETDWERAVIRARELVKEEPKNG